jgi:hypothetical protein
MTAENGKSFESMMTEKKAPPQATWVLVEF